MTSFHWYLSLAFGADFCTGSGAAGFIGHGPLCHYWMLTMEQYLDFNGAWWATGFKVLADQTVWSLYLNAMYSFLIGTLAFRNPKV